VRILVRAEFKHLKANEKEIAERFRNNAYLDGKYIYDVELKASEVIVPAHWTKKDIEHWEALKSKRIDLVVEQDNKVWIIEITPKLSKAAIGGVISYRELYQTQYKPKVAVSLAVVCEVDDPAYHTTCNRFGIKIWVV
jgi:hypothetical protein